MSTRLLFEKLKREQTLQSYMDFYQAFQRKHLQVEGGPCYALPKPQDAEDISHIVQNVRDMGLDIYFAPSAQVKLDLYPPQGTVWYTNTEIPAQRSNSRVAFYNPAAEKPQVWYSPTILPYSKHLAKKGDVSYYFEAQSRDKLELAAFARGKLWLDPREPVNRMYAYHDFKTPIGVSEGKEVSTLLVQIDRMRRNKGYFCGLHGHPRSL